MTYGVFSGILIVFHMCTPADMPHQWPLMFAYAYHDVTLWYDVIGNTDDIII